MGMSTDMAPRYLSVSPSGQMTYVLNTGGVNLAQVQLAVPASEILLIQQPDDSSSKSSIHLCDSPVLVADVSTENVSWIGGNNVIVLVSQPQQQEYVVVEQEVVVDSNAAAQSSWQVESVCDTATLNTHVEPTMALTQYVAKELNYEDDDDWLEQVTEETSITTVEDAKCWFRDSLITTAALSTLTTYVQSNASSKSD